MDKVIEKKTLNSDLWNDAYSRVESFLFSLRLKDRYQINRITSEIIDKVKNEKSDLKPTELAMKELHRRIAEWIKEIVGDKFDRYTAGVKTRMAMIMLDFPEEWTEHFLSYETLPVDIKRKIKESFEFEELEFDKSAMKHKALRFGTTGSIFAGTFKLMGRNRMIKIIVYIIILAIFATLFYYSR